MAKGKKKEGKLEVKTGLEGERGGEEEEEVRHRNFILTRYRLPKYITSLEELCVLGCGLGKNEGIE